jgi:hypothetical protein
VQSGAKIGDTFVVNLPAEESGIWFDSFGSPFHFACGKAMDYNGFLAKVKNCDEAALPSPACFAIVLQDDSREVPLHRVELEEKMDVFFARDQQRKLKQIAVIAASAEQRVADAQGLLEVASAPKEPVTAAEQPETSADPDEEETGTEEDPDEEEMGTAKESGGDGAAVADCCPRVNNEDSEAETPSCEHIHLQDAEDLADLQGTDQSVFEFLNQSDNDSQVSLVLFMM